MNVTTVHCFQRSRLPPFRRCRLNRLGLSYTELDLVFAKHRNWWQRVYEPELLRQAREACHIRGLSFAAFVDLCTQLADRCCCDLGEKTIRTVPSTLHLPEIPLFPKPMPYVTAKPGHCSKLDLPDQKPFNREGRTVPARSCRKSDTSYYWFPNAVDAHSSRLKLRPQFLSNESCVPIGDIHTSNTDNIVRSSSLLNLLHFVEYCCVNSLDTQVC
ncbi:uncharacterized protein DEA37_0000304 [Paragonimus westermani]|uniref:Uncharacterized protein n=1 Tax=Paragonimus westermani TaxID=34504 RepID=A0A5J4NYQ8_9TREM|nr:uncharacterized protein DEA37_0000304 [Paragonimus westermani]